MTIVAIVKYLLHPTLSTMSPSGALQHAATIQVIMMALPADRWVQQNLTCRSLLALSRKVTQRATANMHKVTMSQKDPLSIFRSSHFIYSDQPYTASGSTIFRLCSQSAYRYHIHYFICSLVDICRPDCAQETDTAHAHRREQGRTQALSIIVDDGRQKTIQGITQLWECYSQSKSKCQFFPHKPKRYKAGLSGYQTLGSNAEQHSPHQHSRIAFVGAPSCHNCLEDHNPEGERNQPDPNPKKINQEPNDKGSKYIGEGEDSIEHIILRLINAKLGHDRILEGLRIIECVLITKNNHRQQEQRKESDPTMPIWFLLAGLISVVVMGMGWGVFLACWLLGFHLYLFVFQCINHIIQLFRVVLCELYQFHIFTSYFFINSECIHNTQKISTCWQAPYSIFNNVEIQFKKLFKQSINILQQANCSLLIQISIFFINLIQLLILAYIMDARNQQTTSILTEGNINDPLVEEAAERDRRFVERYFGPMQEGSLRGAIFALLASAMGTGVFNLPERTREIGVLPFAVFIFLGGLFSMIGMIFMVRLILEKKFKSYGEMSQAAYGNVLKRLSQVCIIIYPWGITICFQVIFASFICQLLHDELGITLYSNRDKQELNQTGNLYRIGFNLGCLLLTSIFALKKNISLLQKIAIVGVVSVIFNISTVVVISLTGFTRSDDQMKYRGIFHVDGSKINWFTFDGWESLSLLAQGMASILFCYVNHQMLFPLSMSLRRPNLRRFTKIINRVHIVQFLAYSIIGVTAYLLLLEHIQVHKIAPVVLSSIPTLIITIGKTIMLAALFFAVPLNMFPARQSFFDATNLERNNKNHIIVTMALMCSSTAIAIGFQKVNSYFGLLGGTAGVMMAGGIPGLCYYKLRSKLTALDVALLVLCFLITILAAVGAILSVVDPPSS